MPPINTRKQKLKGTHCFEVTTRFWDDETLCSITLESKSLTTGSDAATGLFYTSPHDRMISLRFTVELNPRSMRAGWSKDYREMHVHSHSLLMWTQTHPAPRNACVIVPWSAWSASAARVVAPGKDAGDVVYMYPSHSRFSGCGMRIVSAAFVQSDGATGVSISDYHPARVFRGLRKEVVYHTHDSQVEVEAGFRYKRSVVNAGRSYPSVHNGAHSGLRSECLPVSRSFGTPCTHSISAMEAIGWYGSPQEPRKVPALRVSRKSAKKMQYLENYIPLPKEFRFDASQPVFNVLCEDAVMFYALVPGSNTIQCAHWYTF